MNEDQYKQVLANVFGGDEEELTRRALAVLEKHEQTIETLRGQLNARAQIIQTQETVMIQQRDQLLAVCEMFRLFLLTVNPESKLLGVLDQLTREAPKIPTLAA